MIARPGGFLFYVGRPFVVARYEAGKMPALHVAKINPKQLIKANGQN